MIDCANGGSGKGESESESVLMPATVVDGVTKIDESLSMALHKDNVFIDLSGWSPKYFQPQIIQFANTQLSKKMQFGSDFPLIHPQKWIDAAKGVGFRDEILPGIMKHNAARVLGLE